MGTFRYQRCYKGPVRGVIFDWAGTTVDFGSRAPASVFMEVFREQGVEITANEARGPMGLAKRDHIREVTRVPRVADTWRERHGSAPSEADIDRMYDAFLPLQLRTLKHHADVIPGVLDTVADLRRRGIRIGSTTGYSRELMEVLVPAAKVNGYVPDNWVAASDVPAGRPAPWMALRSAEQLGIYPLESIIKVGDTVPDIEEGLNAGMWTVGISRTGNEMGLSEAELVTLSTEEHSRRLAAIEKRLLQAGAHFVIPAVADLGPVVEIISSRLAHGERP